MSSLKETILCALEKNDLGAVVSSVVKDKKTLSLLVRFSYDKETLVGRRAIKAVGLAARELVKTDYDFLRETVRKLLWSLSDESGGIGWSAPEILGEIASADPKKFEDIIPLIAKVFDAEEETFRPGVLYALMRIAEYAPELAAGYQDIIIKALEDKEPLVNIYAFMIIGIIWKTAVQKALWGQESKEKIRRLIDSQKTNNKEAWIYQVSDYIIKEVGLESVKLIENMDKFQF